MSIPSFLGSQSQGDVVSGKIVNIDEILDKLQVSTFHYRLLLMCGLAFMADAMEVSLLSFLATCVGEDWNLTSNEIASITSVVFAGELLGAIFWSQIADKFGRRISFICACSLISCGGIFSALSPSLGWLLFFRGLVGFGVGGLNVPFDLLAEFLPSDFRGSFLNYLEIFWTIGSLFVCGVAWALLSTKGWRVLTIITSIPVIISAILTVMYLPESPRWLLICGKIREAECVIRDAFAVNGQDIHAFQLSAEVQESEHFSHGSYMDLIRTKETRRITIPLVLVWFCFGFAYYGVILFVSRLYNTSSDDDSQTCSFDYSSMFINACGELVGLGFTIYIIDRIGRTKTQGMLYVMGGIAVLCMGFGLPRYSILAVAWIARMFAMGSSSATWVATPELFSTDTRASGHSICNAAARIGAFLSPYFVVSNIHIIIVGIGLAIMNICAGISSFSLPETKGIVSFVYL